MSRDWTPNELQTASAAMQAAGHMSYKEFCAEVDATTAAKEKVDAFARRQKDGVRMCPRCGCLTVKDRLATNALSRHADVYICDTCGMDEAIRDMKGDAMPLKDWAAAKLGGRRKSSGMKSRGD